MIEVSQLSEAKRKLLQKYLLGQIVHRPDQAQSISPRATKGFAPLSFSQEQLWRRSLTSPMPLLYNESFTIRRDGPLDISVLERSFREVIRRHEIWRTTYGFVSGEPAQIIHDAPDRISIPVFDLHELDERARKEQYQALAEDQARMQFDLSQGPLLRIMVVRVAAEDFRILACAHLSIVDGISVYQLLVPELASLYDAFARGESSPLPDPRFQYGDFAYWQRHCIPAKLISDQLAYWRKQLSGALHPLRWPTEHTRHSTGADRGTITPFSFSPRLADALVQFNRSEGITLFSVLCAALAALLYHYTGQEDVIIGTPAQSGRKHSEFQGLLGHFLNPVPLRLNLSGDPSFHDLVRQVHSRTIEALANDDVSLEMLAGDLNLSQNARREALFNVALSVQPSMPDTLRGWSITSMDANSGGADWGLYTAFIQRPGALFGRAQYNSDIFEPSTITRTLHELEALLNFVTANPAQRLSALAPS